MVNIFGKKKKIHRSSLGIPSNVLESIAEVTDYHGLKADAMGTSLKERPFKERKIRAQNGDLARSESQPSVFPNARNQHDSSMATDAQSAYQNSNDDMVLFQSKGLSESKNPSETDIEAVWGQAERPKKHSVGSANRKYETVVDPQNKFENFEPKASIAPNELEDADAESEELPSFRCSPSEIGALGLREIDQSFSGMAIKLWQAFTPTQPKCWGRLFAGRRQIIRRIISAIEEDNSNIAIFGARGVGKTSVTNILTESATNVGYLVIRCACSSDIRYQEIFRTFLRGISSDFVERSVKAKLQDIEHLEELLPRGPFGPSEVTSALGHLKLNHAILILDEFDRIKDDTLKVFFAETIKNLSDISARVTIVLAGVSEDLEDLIGKHQSIQRHIIGFHLPLMAPADLRFMINAGETLSGIQFEEVVKEGIIGFSKGLPYYTQLLCLHAGRRALECGRRAVQLQDLTESLKLVLQEADPFVIQGYNRVTRDGCHKNVVKLLRAAAEAPFDKYGIFTAEQVCNIMQRNDYNAPNELTVHRAFAKLSGESGNSVLKKSRHSDGDVRYNFRDQTMRQYILARAALAR